MQLIVILLATVSILTFLSGVIVFFGAKKKDRIRSFMFFLAATFATTWMISIAMFLIADPTWVDTINWHVKWTFVSAILIDVAFLAYIAWEEKYGRAISLVFLLFGLFISTLIFVNPELLYTDIILDRSGNSIILNIGLLYATYIIFFAAIVPAVVVVLLKQFIKSRSDRKKNGDLVIMISFAISSVLTFVGDLILPLNGDWAAVWLGPLALAVTIISFYYAILRYRSLNLSSIWLKIFSYIVIIASIAIVYMVIFSAVFAGLFRGSTPSTEVIILNFIMIVIFIALMPAMNELSNFIRSLISGQSQAVKKPTAKKSQEIHERKAA